MPVTIHEFETTVDVESPATPVEAGERESQAEALQRWQDFARRQAQLEARTAAWGFDD